MKQLQELDPRRDFPRWLRTVRTRSRLSQARLGEEIGAFGGEISWWEAAKSKPSHEQLQRLFDYFAVDEEPDLTALPPVEDDDDDDALPGEDEAASVVAAPPAARPAAVVVEAARASVQLALPVVEVDDETDEVDEHDDDEHDDDDDEQELDEVSASGSSSHPLALPVPPREELEQLYARRKLSIKLIGEHFGVSTRTARKWLRESGIELRSLSEQMRHSARRGESSAAAPAAPVAVVAPEPPRPVDLTRSVRVRRRDEERPARRAGAEYDIDDETGRVVRVAPPMPQLPVAPPPPEPEPEDNGRVRVLDLSDELQRSPRPAPERRMRLVAPPMRSNGSRARSGSTTSVTFDGPRTPRDNVMHTATRASGLGAATAAVASAGSPGNLHRPHAELVRWHLDEGFSIPELVQRTGQPARAVREQLREAGIKIRSWREPLAIGRTDQIPPRETLARQIELGVEIEDLASSYEVSIARVRGWFDCHNLVPETHTRVERYTRIDDKQAAIVAIADGTSVTVDPELSFAMAAHSWTLDAAGRPITRFAGTDIPLSWVALGREPGEPIAAVEHRNGDLLDCRRANLDAV